LLLLPVVSLLLLLPRWRRAVFVGSRRVHHDLHPLVGVHPT
jgi:hypothetical protein